MKLPVIHVNCLSTDSGLHTKLYCAVFNYQRSNLLVSLCLSSLINLSLSLFSLIFSPPPFPYEGNKSYLLFKALQRPVSILVFDICNSYHHTLWKEKKRWQDTSRWGDSLPWALKICPDHIISFLMGFVSLLPFLVFLFLGQLPTYAQFWILFLSNL